MKGRVLIIDDEAEIRRNLTVGLTQEDYTAVACPDGISAIHELNQAREKGIAYDYMVTDIFMPDIDGLKILKVIKNQYPDLPVLVITGFGDERLELTALSENNTGFLDKPFEISDLVAALEELAPGRTSIEADTPVVDDGMRESVSGYLTVKITQPERSMEIFDTLYAMEGIQSCDAVRGDFDIILLAQAGSTEEIQAVFEKVRALEGVEVLSMSQVERPKLDRDVDQFIETYQKAVKGGAVKRFVVMAGCDGRQKGRSYFTDVATALPPEAVILTAGCAKYRYNKLGLGETAGLPRVIDAGQCNDSYSLAVIALKLKEILELDDINDLPISYDIAWYEQKAVAVLLALLALGVKNIRLGPTLPAFLSPNVATVLVEKFGIRPTGEAASDAAAIMEGR